MCIRDSATPVRDAALSPPTPAKPIRACGPSLGFRLRSGLSPLLTTVPRWILFSDAQLGDNGTIPLDVLLGQVVQHLAALTDHLQQAAAAVVVVDVDLQVLGELLNPGGEDGDLDLGGAGVRGMGAVGLDDGRLFVLTNHGIVPPF